MNAAILVPLVQLATRNFSLAPNTMCSSLTLQWVCEVALCVPGEGGGEGGEERGGGEGQGRQGGGELLLHRLPLQGQHPAELV